MIKAADYIVPSIEPEMKRIEEYFDRHIRAASGKFASVKIGRPRTMWSNDALVLAFKQYREAGWIIETIEGGWIFTPQPRVI